MSESEREMGAPASIITIVPQRGDDAGYVPGKECRQEW